MQKQITSVMISMAVLGGTAVVAEETASMEEIVVVGTQIKGARIADALPVSVITAADIEALTRA